MNQIYKSLAAATIALTAAVALSACNDNRDCAFDGDAHTLACPEKTYATVDMGGKVWMAENLVVYVPDSSVCYGNDHANCDAMGRLYTWNAANNGLCPNGWALPSQEDFKKAFGTASTAELRSANGFKMVLGGFRYYDGNFADKGMSASFWTKDSFDDSRAFLVRVADSAVSYEHFNKSIAASVRCVKE